MLRTFGLVMAATLLASCAAAPTTPLGSPSPSGGRAPTASLSPGADPSGEPGAPSVGPSPSVEPSAFHPLPRDLVLVPGPNDPSASLTADSGADAEPGRVEPFTLQHCGLGSPFDFDGSLWDPIAGHDGDGAPIDSEEEIGELINQTEGEVLLLGSGQVQFRTPAGSIILLTRHVGAKTYFLCA